MIARCRLAFLHTMEIATNANGIAPAGEIQCHIGRSGVGMLTVQHPAKHPQLLERVVHP